MSDRTAVKFYQADVFTDTVFGGNPVAVVPEADGLSDVEMQKIAREMNLSETVFVLKPTTKAAQYRLRFFTPTQEIAFAGHPVVGAFYVLVHVGIVTLYEPLTRIYQETHVGVFTVEITAREGRIRHIMMSQPAPEFLGVVEPLRDLFEVAKAVGVPKTTITGTGLPVEIVSTGFPVMVVPVRTLVHRPHTDVRVPCRRGGRSRHGFCQRRARCLSREEWRRRGGADDRDHLRAGL